jgi:hypothetical protein
MQVRNMQPERLLAISLYILALGGVRAAEIAIPPWSPTLQSELVHWKTPFTATYKKGDAVLVVVAAEHVFTPDNSTVNAITTAFAIENPEFVIVEGFPTVMGESPQALVDEEKQRGKPGASSYANGEGMYAASLAIAHQIPFVGGEPSYAEQVDALVRKGYSLPDISFTFVLRDLGQDRRSGKLPIQDNGEFERTYEQAARNAARVTKSQPIPYADFSSRYRDIYGLDFKEDQKFDERNDPGTGTMVAAIGQADMTGRDEHLLATIRKEIAARKRVLVVYGNGHWTTLSAALEGDFGKPTIR